MGLLLALLYDRTMRRLEATCLQAWRRELLVGVRGDVLEIGAGTGANIPAYVIPETRRIVLAEPDRHMRARLAARPTACAGSKFECVDVAAERLGFADASFDCVVSTLVLCSVADPAAALREVHRVLRPGGALFFLEHVVDECDPVRARWQRWLDPLWRRCAGGCRLTRRTEALIGEAGFAMESITRADMRPAPTWVRRTIRGVARRSS